MATNGISRAELEFKKKLEEWSKQKTVLENRLTRLDRETRPRAAMPGSRRRSSDSFSSATNNPKFTLSEQEVRRVQELQQATWGLLRRAESTSTQASYVLKSLSKIADTSF